MQYLHIIHRFSKQFSHLAIEILMGATHRGKKVPDARKSDAIHSARPCVATRGAQAVDLCERVNRWWYIISIGQLSECTYVYVALTFLKNNSWKDIYHFLSNVTYFRARRTLQLWTNKKNSHSVQLIFDQIRQMFQLMVIKKCSGMPRGSTVRAVFEPNRLKASMCLNFDRTSLPSVLYDLMTIKQL